MLALTAVLATACGAGSSSDDASSSGGSTSSSAPSGSLELRPVFARYAEGLPLQIGPTVPKDVLAAMKTHDCRSGPSELQGMLLVCDAADTVYLLKEPIVTGGVSSATPEHIGHQKQWYLKMALDQQASGILSQASQSMAGTELAIVLEDHVLSAPIVDSSMADGHLVITGDFDQASATRLAHRLGAGS